VLSFLIFFSSFAHAQENFLASRTEYEVFFIRLELNYVGPGLFKELTAKIAENARYSWVDRYKEKHTELLTDHLKDLRDFHLKRRSMFLRDVGKDIPVAPTEKTTDKKSVTDKKNYFYRSLELYRPEKEFRNTPIARYTLLRVHDKEKNIDEIYLAAADILVPPSKWLEVPE
jgi:hypothetical protein